MVIGIPKEIMHEEKRVAAIPETVQKMVASGNTVLVQAGAGLGALHTDDDFRAAGAEVVADCAEVYRRADLVLKVKEPLFNEEKGLHEVDMMHEGQALITFIHPASPVNHDMVRLLAQKGVCALTLDSIPRITRAQNMDALTSMSTVAGYKGIMMAASDLEKFAPQIMCAVGMIKPANVLVIGAGVSGLQAIATAKRLGAVVHALDIRPDAAEQAKSLGAKVIDTGVPADIAVGSGGYANSLPAEWLEKERAVLAEVVKGMDIVFCSALVPGRQAPVLLSEAAVQGMAAGSVIVDISIDQGGNCAITTPGARDVKHGVVIEGIKNIPGHLAISSTWMFANNMANLVQYLVRDGQLQLDMADEICRAILVCQNGEIVHAGAREAMGMREDVA